MSGCEALVAALTRISHKVSTAAAQPGMSTALRSLGLLDVLSSTPAGPWVARWLAKRRIHARLRRLATKPCEKCGLRVAIEEAKDIFRERNIELRSIEAADEVDRIRLLEDAWMRWSPRSSDRR